MRWRVKKLSTGGAGGNGRTILITSWKCNFSIYLDIQVYYFDIQAIATLHAFYWLFMCCFLLFSHFLPYNHSPEKWNFPALKRHQTPQFSTYRHRAGFIVKRKQVRIILYIMEPLNWCFFFLIFKVAYFGKKTRFSKNSSIFFWFFFLGIYIGLYVYMYYMQW